MNRQLPQTACKRATLAAAIPLPDPAGSLSRRESSERDLHGQIQEWVRDAKANRDPVAYLLELMWLLIERQERAVERMQTTVLNDEQMEHLTKCIAAATRLSANKRLGALDRRRRIVVGSVLILCVTVSAIGGFAAGLGWLGNSMIFATVPKCVTQDGGHVCYVWTSPPKAVK